MDNASNGALIRDIQSILHALADLSQDITEFLDSSFHGTVGRGSKMAVRLMLAQHHVSVPLYLMHFFSTHTLNDS